MQSVSLANVKRKGREKGRQAGVQRERMRTQTREEKSDSAKAKGYRGDIRRKRKGEAEKESERQGGGLLSQYHPLSFPFS